jgi:multiple sugar transport system substrate-binding protein
MKQERNMKRAGLFVLMMALSMVVFAGAGQQDQTSSPGEITIEYWNVSDPAQSQDGVSMQEKFAEYEQAHPGVKIVHNAMIYNQLREKAIISGQAKTGADFLHMLGEWVPEFAGMGLIQDITPEIRAWEDYKNFPESTWKVGTVDGRIYGIPSIASTRVLLYREDLFKEAGVSVPTTWTELRDTAKKLTKGDVYGFAFCSASKSTRGSQEFGVALYSVGKGEFAVQQNGKWVPGFTIDQAEKVFQFYYDLMFVDKSVPPFSIGWDYPELDNAFASGTMAMCQDGAWMRNRVANSENSNTWKTAAFPYDNNPSTYMEVKIEGIGSFTKNRQAVLDFAKWLYNKDNSVYISRTNNLPARSDSPQSQYWINDPVWRTTFLDNVPYGFTMPSIPIPDILHATMDNVQEVLYRRMTPRQSAEDFYNKVKRYLDNEIN